ncbi:putative metal dependent phosphohydrolase [Phaeobacter piscinae]|uniref:Metal dependent phosphohydrolase n=1 Tax=Phaeobacter piscinae TaxID=1580596 RepID=A0ABM6PDB1_9RHOB|nr:HD-GYP domain-containing protein [Phaeobacter piscinae]ATG35702.1 putative metal dependent phosphohydrolase [Phaeobacter piscinae]AUQ86223.1 putative metal dependent phosphohydrolase [Phaeobacter piscinae]AUR24106.1 putative metal dependent phosphohydrolase [Phaeobacter piscinae]
MVATPTPYSLPGPDPGPGFAAASTGVLHDVTYPRVGGQTIQLGELLGALSHALDLTEGQPRGHCVRCCWIGMQVADYLHLSRQDRSDLYFTLLLKDLGCSSNAARISTLYRTDDLSFKRNFKFVDDTTRKKLDFLLQHTGQGDSGFKRLKTVTGVIARSDSIATELIQTRCDRGAKIARLMRFSERIAGGIAALDEHWNGGGHPAGISRKDISLFSRIALMAQVTDVFALQYGSGAAADELESRAGSWFDPELVPVFTRVIRTPGFYDTLTSDRLETSVFSDPAARATLRVDDTYMDDISYAFSKVIDAKSPFTYGHSERVAHYTDMICETLGFELPHRRWMVRAGLLHDLGKLGVSNAILDKPGRLSDQEMKQMKLHPEFGYEVLRRISVFQDIADVVVAHHERLDGKGYPYGLGAADLTVEMRILTVADIFDAMTADRPYQSALPLEKAFATMDEMQGTAIDPEIHRALKEAIAASPWPAREARPFSPNY